MSSYLSIYLNDHLAGSIIGANLARRAEANNRDNDYGERLAALATEIAEDKQSLEALMGTLDVSCDPFKAIAAWAGERLGRLKPNGRLLHYSPLSRLEEIEMLALGVTGKVALWQALRRTLADDLRVDAEELDRLIVRAESQRRRLEDLRLRAAADALGAPQTWPLA